MLDLLQATIVQEEDQQITTMFKSLKRNEHNDTQTNINEQTFVKLSLKRGPLVHEDVVPITTI
jgi:hypothetical protein